MEYSRRSFLGSVCTVGSSVWTANVLRTIPDGTVASRVDRSWSLERIGHSLLSDPPGGYAEGAVRADGRYAVLGSKFGNGGSFLVDLSDPTAPREAHRLPVPERTISPDVKFDPRDGLYYRSLEGNGGGVDVVDYGFGDAAADGPAVLSTMDAGDTHNVFPHPDAPVVYAVDDHGDTPGLDVWDVSDPSDPGMARQAGPDGVLHDAVIDPDRDLAHAAYIGGDFEGYAILDTADPWSPVEVGRFDYGDYSDYDDVGFGDEAFQNCHYADYDPDRKLAVVGDEVAKGAPAASTSSTSAGIGDRPETPSRSGSRSPRTPA